MAVRTLALALVAAVLCTAAPNKTEAVAKRPCPPKTLAQLHAQTKALRALTAKTKAALRGVKNATVANATAANASNSFMLRRPDPTCKTGVLSLAGTPSADQQVCCPSYCGECSDYPTCSSVRGQDSKYACCASDVLSMSCGSGAPANKCIKSCTEATPPCVMTAGESFEMPEASSAGDDCNEAVDEWMDAAESAVKAAPGGDEQWEEMEREGEILKFQQNHKKGTKKKEF